MKKYIENKGAEKFSAPLSVILPSCREGNLMSRRNSRTKFPDLREREDSPCLSEKLFYILFRLYGLEHTFPPVEICKSILLQVTAESNLRAKEPPTFSSRGFAKISFIKRRFWGYFSFFFAGVTASAAGRAIAAAAAFSLFLAPDLVPDPESDHPHRQHGDDHGNDGSRCGEQ